MLFHIFTGVCIALFGEAAAQSSSSTSSAPVPTHTISVGADGLNFSPNQVFANKGDIIEYRFYPQNHSVARAAFGPEPCIPYELTAPGRVGFWSGFNPVALVLSNPPIFRLQINDTDPLFFYCSSPGACLEGMVGVVNPNATFTYAQQFNYTQNATLDFSPGEYFPKETKPTRTTTATGATFTPTPSMSSSSSLTSIAALATSTASDSELPAHPHSSNSSLGAGPIAGIVIGAVAVVALASALLYMCGRQRSVKELLRHQHQAPSYSPNPQGHNSYQTTVSGMSEAVYPNVRKSPVVSGDGGRWTEEDSYRSLSSDCVERGMVVQGAGRSPPVGSQGFQPSSGPGPAFFSEQEREHAQAIAGMRPYHPSPPAQPASSNGPHELASPDETRPFSYTDSESGYIRPRDRDGKDEANA